MTCIYDSNYKTVFAPNSKYYSNYTTTSISLNNQNTGNFVKFDGCVLSVKNLMTTEYDPLKRIKNGKRLGNFEIYE
jgi:hypothetical protein